MRVRFTNLEKFERDVKRFAKSTETSVAVVCKKLAFDVLAGVTERTPVLTGYAKSGWRFAVGKPDLSVPTPGSIPGDSGAKASNAEQIAKLQADNTKFPRYFITNAVRYIWPLEEGHSKQSGKGYMVRRTLNTIQDTIVKINAEIRKVMKQ